MTHEHRSATPEKRAASRTRRGRQAQAQESESVALLTSALETTSFDAAARRQLIAETAYFRAAQRGFEPGHELDDWLSAECEVDQRLRVDMH